MAAGRNLPSNKLSWNDKAADMIVRAAALSCPQASCHGAFPPPCRTTGKRENRRNQSHLSRRPESPGPSAYGLHMAEFAPECKGRHVAAQQNKTDPSSRDWHLMNSRPPLRRASLDTSPPIDGGEERRELRLADSLPLPPEGGEVAPRSGDGVGEALRETRGRRKTGTTGRAKSSDASLWYEAIERSCRDDQLPSALGGNQMSAADIV